MTSKSKNAHLHAVLIARNANPTLDAELAGALVREFALRFPGSISRDPEDRRYNMIDAKMAPKLIAMALDPVVCAKVRRDHVATICAAMAARRRPKPPQDALTVKVDGLLFPMTADGQLDLQQIIDAVVADNAASTLVIEGLQAEIARIGPMPASPTVGEGVMLHNVKQENQIRDLKEAEARARAQASQARSTNRRLEAANAALVAREAILERAIADLMAQVRSLGAKPRLRVVQMPPVPQKRAYKKRKTAA